jgi:ribonucleoside-diphosphate reductase subunit M1
MSTIHTGVTPVSSISFDQIVKVLEGLDNVDVEDILAKVTEVGVLNTGRIFGFDVAEYQNLEASGRLLMLHHQHNTPKTFKEFFIVCADLIGVDVYNFVMEHGDTLQQAIEERKHNDFDCDWFSASTEYRQYLWRKHYDQDPVETVQYQHMRLAVQFYYNSFNAVEEIIECYKVLSDGFGTHASPTIFNACRILAQMSSCFLNTIGDDLWAILHNGVVEGGMISKVNGGLGFDVSRVRHSEITGTGMSQGVVPMLLLYNMGVRYVDQGGRRKGAATVYLRPHHIDIEDFISMVDKIGDQYTRAHDINIAIWFPWVFWDRIRDDGDWTLFCPAKTKQLNDIWGKEFEYAYVRTEKAQPGDAWYVNPKYRKTMKARELLDQIVDMQIKTGMPYVMHADACNMKSNQRHLGYIRCGNLCLEIIEFSSDDEISSCNLASISLRKFTKAGTRVPDTILRLKAGNAGASSSFVASGSSGSSAVTVSQDDIVARALTECYDFDLQGMVVRRFVKNLNKVIDNNWCPLDKTSKKTGLNKPGKIRRSNSQHRPIGLGVSGWAEALHAIDLSFVDPTNHKAINTTTKLLNKMVWANIYFNGLVESVQLAIIDGKYDSFEGSPFSKGQLQFDLWEEEAKVRGYNVHCTKEDNTPLDPALWRQPSLPLYDAANNIIYVVEPTWESLKAAVVRFGTRNSLITTIMPTATTAQKLRNCEAAEAHTANLYSRKVMNGAYPVLNRYMVDDLRELGLWNLETLHYIQVSNGSIKDLHGFVASHLSDFPDFDQTSTSSDRLRYVQTKYLTMWEITGRIMLRYTADRGRYIDQSQSTNIYIDHPTPQQLIAMHRHTDDLRLKTGMYYLRQQPPSEPVKFTCNSDIANYVKTVQVEVQTKKDPEKGNGEADEICTISFDEEGEMVKSCCA